MPSIEAVRHAAAPRTWQHVAEQSRALARMEGRPDLLWTRGLVRDTTADWVLKPVGDIYEKWTASGTLDCFIGDVYGDGSLLGRGPWAQCGWATVARQNNETVRVCWGPLPVALPVQPHADIPTTMTAAPGVQQWRGAAR